MKIKCTEKISMNFYDKRCNFLCLILLLLPFFTLASENKKVIPTDVLIQISPIKIINVSIKCQNHKLKEEYPLQIFSIYLLKIIKSFLNMKDFIKFTFSLPENQQKYLFRVYLFNYFRVYDENCKPQNLNFQKLNFCSVCEAIGYDSKLLLSSKSFDNIRLSTQFFKDKIVRFQINGDFIPFEQFYHTRRIFTQRVFYHFTSNHLFAIRFEKINQIDNFVTEMKFFGKIKIEGEGNCSFNPSWFEVTKFSIPSDLHVINEPSLEQHRKFINNLTKFGNIVDQICFAYYCPKLLTIRAILLFRLVTPMPFILLLLFFSCHATATTHILVFSFNMISRNLENIYFFLYDNLKKFKAIYSSESVAIEQFLTKFGKQSLVFSNLNILLLQILSPLFHLAPILYFLDKCDYQIFYVWFCVFYIIFELLVTPRFAFCKD